MSHGHRLLALLLSFLLLQSCTMITPPAGGGALREYSLGRINEEPLSPPAARPLQAVLLVSTAEAPSWFDSQAIYYRLAYAGSENLQPYASSSWVAPVSELLTQRLRAYLAARGPFASVLSPEDGARADYALRVSLEDFSQVFTDTRSSSGVVRARFTLVDLSNHKVLAQRIFQQEAPAPSPNAQGGAGALDQASEALIRSVVAWLVDLAPALRPAGVVRR